MKKYIIITIFILIGLVSFLVTFLVREIKEKNRLKENFEIEIKNERERQQTISKKELKEYYSDDIENLKEYGVKTRQIENIVNIRYNIIDTLIYKDTLVYHYDTIKKTNIASFEVESKCNIIRGSIFENNIEINEIYNNDTLLISLYKEKKKCLFKKRGIKAIAISSCNNDTLTILRNLKIK